MQLYIEQTEVEGVEHASWDAWICVKLTADGGSYTGNLGSRNVGNYGSEGLWCGPSSLPFHIQDTRGKWVPNFLVYTTPLPAASDRDQGR